MIERSSSKRTVKVNPLIFDAVDEYGEEEEEDDDDWKPRTASTRKKRSNASEEVFLFFGAFDVVDAHCSMIMLLSWHTGDGGEPRWVRKRRR